MANIAVVKYENLIEVGSHLIGNVDNYDHYISATVNTEDSFTYELLNHFTVSASVAFFGLNDTIPNDLPISVFKKHLSSARSENTVNLDFYTSNFNNIFLRVDANGDEIAWLNYVSEEKLNRIKQLLITLNPSGNEAGLQKLANTHYPIRVSSKGEKVVVTYLRKDLVVIEEPVPVVVEEPVVVVDDEVVLEEPVQISEETVVEEEPAPVSEEPTPVAEEPTPVAEEPTPVALEEPVVIVEEPVVIVEEPVVIVEEPVVIVEEPVVIVEEPVVITEEPVALEEPVVIAEEPVVEEEVVHESVSEELTSEDSSEEQPTSTEESTEEPTEAPKKRGRPRKQK
jgi:hypothetical protein